MEPNKITDMSSDALIHMMSFLNIKDVVKLSEVSKLFQQLDNNTTIWNSRLIQFYHEIGEKVKQLPSNPKQEIIKMMENKKKIAQIIDYYGVEDKDETIKKEIESDQNFLSERYINGDTLLHQVVASGPIRSGSHLILLMDSILKNGGRFDQKNCEGMTPLHLAANYCSDRTTSQQIFPWLVEKGLTCGFDFNQKDNHGRTVLHLIAQNFYSYRMSGITDNVELLIKKIPESLDINAKDNLGFTALDYAFSFGNTAAIGTLLAAGADIQKGICSQDIDQALKSFSVREVSIHERRGTLIDEGQKETIEEYRKLDFSNMPLTEAIDKFHYLFKIPHSEEIQHYLNDSLREIVRKTDSQLVNTQDDNGYGLLHVAVQSNQADIVKLLLEKGVNPDIRNSNDITPILLSLLQAREQAFHALLNAKVKLPETMQDLPLKHAVIRHCHSAAILESVWNSDEINPNDTLTIKYDDGDLTRKRTLIDWAIQSENYQAIFALLKKGAIWPW